MADWKGEEITTENMDRIAADMEAEWEVLKEKLKKKPDWMIDENSTYGEVLEFHAVTAPFKYQQLIEVEERQAASCREMARMVKDSMNKERWLRKADEAESHAAEMRLKLSAVRKTAQVARKELEDLL